MKNSSTVPMLSVVCLTPFDITSFDIINSSRDLKTIFVSDSQKKPAFGTTPLGALMNHKVYTNMHVPKNQQREAANPFPAISYYGCIPCPPTTFLRNTELEAKIFISAS